MQMNKLLLALASAAFVAGTANAQLALTANRGVKSLKTEKLQSKSAAALQLQKSANNNFKIDGVQGLGRNARVIASPTHDAKSMSYLYDMDSYEGTDMQVSSMGLSYSNIKSMMFGYGSYFPTNVTSAFAGNTIKSVSFIPYLGVYTNAKVIIFDTSFNVLKSVDVETVNPLELNTVDINYSITGKSALVVAFMANIAASDEDQYSSYGPIIPLLADPSQQGASSYVFYGSGGNYATYGTVSDSYGFPLWVTTDGDAALPENDITVGSTTTNRSKSIGGTFDTSINFQNNGHIPVSKLNYTVSLRSQDGNTVKSQSGEYTLESPVAYFGVGTLPFTAFLPDTKGWAVDSINVSAVNGNADATPDDNYTQFYAYSIGEDGYQRRPLIEEWTNTACGYCPRGIVGMDALAAKYDKNSDSEINDISIVTVHAQPYSQNDPLGDATYNSEYYEIVYGYGAGLPSAFINRQTQVDPYYGSNDEATSADEGIVQTVADYITANPVAECTIGVKSNYDADTKTVTVSSTTRSQVPTQDGEYSVAYILTENGLSGTQTNYYANYTSQISQFPTDIQAIVKKGSSYKAEYNYVSRYNTNAQGYYVQNGYITGYYDAEGAALPAIAQGRSTTHTTEFTLSSDVNVDNCNIVAVIYDNKTGEVVNTSTTWLGYTTTGISQAELKGIDAQVAVEDGAFNVTAENAKAEVYSVDGKLMSSCTVNGQASLPTFGKGVYVLRVVQDGKVLTKKAVF